MRKLISSISRKILSRFTTTETESTYLEDSTCDIKRTQGTMGVDSPSLVIRSFTWNPSSSKADGTKSRNCSITVEFEARNCKPKEIILGCEIYSGKTKRFLLYLGLSPRQSDLLDTNESTAFFEVPRTALQLVRSSPLHISLVSDVEVTMPGKKQQQFIKVNPTKKKNVR